MLNGFSKPKHTIFQQNKLTYWGCQKEVNKKIKAYGLLVLLGFDVTIFTPIAYQRHSL